MKQIGQQCCPENKHKRKRVSDRHGRRGMKVMRGDVWHKQGGEEKWRSVGGEMQKKWRKEITGQQKHRLPANSSGSILLSPIHPSITPLLELIFSIPHLHPSHSSFSPPSLQLSQCNVNDVPSIAPDSARTLTSSPPPFLQCPVISLFSHTHIYSPFHTPPSLISPLLFPPPYISHPSLSHKVFAFQPHSPTASHVCHLSSLRHFILLFHSPSSISQVLHCSFRASALSSSLHDPIFYFYPSSFLPSLGCSLVH